jgi:2,3,4,5-tetrahydropyridine-2-carboxylate N-succinyltransferase/tetrahydrodipicolinate N-acetyltransferase
MNPEGLKSLKLWVGRFWLMSPERLWLLSIALQKRGHWVLAFWIKQLNTLLYHNSLAPGASVSPDIRLGHNSIGIVVTSAVVIGRRVKIWHNVTLSAGRLARARLKAPAAHADGEPSAREGVRPSPGSRSQIIIEDGVTIGANSVVIAPRGCTLRIGRGARIGAGTVVTQDVPAGGTMVGPPSRLLPSESTAEESSE